MKDLPSGLSRGKKWYTEKGEIASKGEIFFTRGGARYFKMNQCNSNFCSQNFSKGVKKFSAGASALDYGPEEWIIIVLCSYSCSQSIVTSNS